MATAHIAAEIGKPSFVGAASASVKMEQTARPPIGQPISPFQDHGARKLPPLVDSQRPSRPARSIDLAASSAINKVEASLNHLSLASSVPGLMVDASTPATTTRSQASIGRGSGSDDSQRADSNSELGTKPPSMDGKSITSGTTFALDEKESLRPDDSASVKAAAEDDDSSIRDSMIAGSRMGSDLAVRARGIQLQLGDMPERRLVQHIPGTHNVLTPQMASSEQPSGMNPPIPLRSASGSSDALNVIYRQAPDEKLLEALAAPRDRLFLLRLEKDVIDFVQDSKEPYMDLPPSNSFCRMLTHKLADYYHMTHSYEPHIGSVRIFRTPFCRVPPSLATMIPPPAPSSNGTPPPAVLPRKIMRRGQDDEGGIMSAGTSKPTSETGSDAKDKQPLANQKLSREEREEMYKLARQRIFGNSEETASENDDYGISRTSSVSATNKSASGKKGKPKQRRDDSDGYDPRRQYTPYWATAHQTWIPQPQGQLQGHYMQNGQYHAQSAPAYPPPMGSMYPQQPSYPSAPGAMTNASYPPYPMPQYNSQPDQQRFQQGGSPMTAYGSPVLPAVPTQPQVWQPGFPQPYQGRGVPPPGPPAAPGPGVMIPYPFGQLPVNVNPHDPKSQHPIPGSYNRHAFNPKTQSFVPAGSSMVPQPPQPPQPLQPLQPPFSAPGSHHGSPQIGGPHLALNGYLGVMPPPPPYGSGGGYNMARQGSNSSMAAAAAAAACYTPPHPQHAPVPPVPNQLPMHAAGRANMIPQLFNGHLPFGSSATLPQKPAGGM